MADEKLTHEEITRRVRLAMKPPPSASRQAFQQFLAGRAGGAPLPQAPKVRPPQTTRPPSVRIGK